MAKNVTKEFKEIVVFTIVGGIMTFVNLGILFLLVEVFLINHIIANIISYIIAVIISYFINARVTFKQPINNTKEEAKNLIEYCIMKVIFLILDTIGVFILVNKLKINLYFSKIILTIIFTIGSFLLSKKIINKKENR